MYCLSKIKVQNCTRNRPKIWRHFVMLKKKMWIFDQFLQNLVGFCISRLSSCFWNCSLLISVCKSHFNTQREECMSYIDQFYINWRLLTTDTMTRMLIIKQILCLLRQFKIKNSYIHWEPSWNSLKW